jgi:hypothetical protein
MALRRHPWKITTCALSFSYLGAFHRALNVVYEVERVPNAPKRTPKNFTFLLHPDYERIKRSYEILLSTVPPIRNSFPVCLLGVMSTGTR